MLVTDVIRDVGDNLKMLVTVLTILVTNIQKMSPRSKSCHRFTHFKYWFAESPILIFFCFLFFKNWPENAAPVRLLSITILSSSVNLKTSRQGQVILQ